MKKKIALLLLICATIICSCGCGGEGKSAKTLITTASLEKMLDVSDLSTMEYTYNSIVTKNDEGGNLMYRVAYEGTVTAGIDFSKIEVTVDNETKKVSIVLPEVVIQDTVVDGGSLDFIFQKSKYETDTVNAEGYKLCVEDLKNKATSDNSILTVAYDNAKEAVEALVAPWIEQLDSEYTVEIR